VLAIIQVLFDAKSRGAALGAYGTTIGLGTIIGPLAGGLLIQASITADAWRPIFLVNVLVNVNRERAGIASGVLATMQQVGGAVGVAVLGIIFFGLIGHNASQAAGNASPAVAAAARAAGAPASASTRAAAVFEQCFTERARSADPTVTPPGCAVAGSPPGAARGFQQATADATARTYSSSFAQALWYQVGIYLLVLALVFALPKASPRQLAELEEQLTAAAG
jgi:MFS family permease